MEIKRFWSLACLGLSPFTNDLNKSTCPSGIRVSQYKGCSPHGGTGQNDRDQRPGTEEGLIVVNKGYKALSLGVTQSPPSDTVLWRQPSPSAPKFPPVLGEEVSNTLTCAQKLDDLLVRGGTKRKRYITYNDFSNLQIFVLKESCILITNS